MRVDKIALRGFRNYEFETVSFNEGINVISGENAQGKTNLLEAVYLLSTGRGFRTRLDRELVGFGYDSAEVLADIESGGRQSTVNIKLAPGRKKQVSVNMVKRATGELSEYFSCVLFNPDDLGLVKEGAQARRRFLDMAIAQLRPGYAALVAEYTRVWEHKSAILRESKEKPSLLYTLDDFSLSLCKLSAKILRYRAAYIKRLNTSAQWIQSDFSGKTDKLELEYKTVSTVSEVYASEREIFEQICKHQEEHKAAEIAAMRCLTGVHTDDLYISINERPARSFASQGQTRTAALSLKLAEREIFLQERGEYPVLLLDDVLSELDAKRQDFVLNRIGGGQTLISCCNGSEIEDKTGGRVFRVDAGRVRG